MEEADKLLTHEGLSLFTLEELLHYFPTRYNGDNIAFYRWADGTGWTVKVGDISVKSNLKYCIEECIIRLDKIFSDPGQRKEYDIIREHVGFSIHHPSSRYLSAHAIKCNPFGRLKNKVKERNKEQLKVTLNVKKIILLKRYNNNDIIFFEQTEDIIKAHSDLATNMKIECKKGTGEIYLETIGIKPGEYKIIDISDESK